MMNTLNTPKMQDPSRMTFNDSQFSPEINEMHSNISPSFAYSPYDTVGSHFYQVTNIGERVSISFINTTTKVIDL